MPAYWQRCVTSIRARNSAAPSKYQNLMYLVAGMVAERIAGQPLEDFVRARILDPLGMADTTTSLEEMVSEHTNHAAPHMFQTCFLGCRCGQSIPGPTVASARPLPT